VRGWHRQPRLQIKDVVDDIQKKISPSFISLTLFHSHVTVWIDIMGRLGSTGSTGSTAVSMKIFKL
jgi:hypothetical protein